MSTLDEAFAQLGSVLRSVGGTGATIAFVAVGPGETGAWHLDLARGTVARSRREDGAPALVVEGAAAVLLLWLAGGLDAAKAIESGALTLRGDRTMLTVLADALAS